MDFYPLLRRILFDLDAETAHGLTIRALNSAVGPRYRPPADPRLKRKILKLEFPNPLGMAAGFDKNGIAVDAVLGLGFGFAEVGTVTPKPQAGNDRPRLFRLPEDHAVINRFGFANEGNVMLRQRLQRRQRRGLRGIVGVNIGANKDAKDRTADYVAGVEAFASLASYFTINVSSPNTPGLRDLQSREHLGQLLARVRLARDESAGLAELRVPLLLKIAPDIDDHGLADIAEVALAHQVDGLIVSNTTLSRDGLTSPLAHETGGLSGRPLFERSTRMLALTRALVGPNMVIIGVGGIDSVETAWTKIAAGADLIQIYSGLVYEGPDLVRRIIEGFTERLTLENRSSIAELVGSEMGKWL